MTGQWEKYVEQAAQAMAGHPARVPEWRRRLRPAIELVGPLIAEEARERLVAAAERAVKREMS